MTAAPLPGLTVVVCSHNGGARIARVLAALAAQTTARAFEVVLVDNASTDGLAGTARAAWEGRAAPLSIVAEPNPGLSVARRRGVDAARHELVVFCDDDNLLGPTYLDEAARLMDDPRIAAVGGPGIPLFEAPPPAFVFARIGYYGCGDRYGPGDDVGAGLAVVSDGEPRNLFGAGLVARRDDLRALYALPGFPVLTGRAGPTLAGGEDCEICFMLAIAGGLLVYSDALRFEHIIPASRLTADYFRRLVAEGEAGRAYWRRLADVHVVRRDGWRLVRRHLARALLTLATGRGERTALFRLAALLRLSAPMMPLMTMPERRALAMGARAAAMVRARPLTPRPVRLPAPAGPARRHPAAAATIEGAAS